MLEQQPGGREKIRGALRHVLLASVCPVQDVPEPDRSSPIMERRRSFFDVFLPEVPKQRRLTEALFHRGDATMMKQSPLIKYEQLHFKTLVTQIDQYEVDGKKQWRITDDDNIKYAPFDWLVVSSAELASPYSPDSAFFGQARCSYFPIWPACHTCPCFSLHITPVRLLNLQVPPLARAAETINNPDFNDAITGIAGGESRAFSSPK